MELLAKLISLSMRRTWVRAPHGLRTSQVSTWKPSGAGSPPGARLPSTVLGRLTAGLPPLKWADRGSSPLSAARIRFTGRSWHTFCARMPRHPPLLGRGTVVVPHWGIGSPSRFQREKASSTLACGTDGNLRYELRRGLLLARGLAGPSSTSASRTACQAA